MNTSFRFTTLAFALFVCTHLFAQKKTFPGFYITTQGDTITGSFPNNTYGARNPATVEFVAAGSSQPILLTPQNSRKLVANDNDEFVSYTGPRMVNPIEDNELDRKKELTVHVDEFENISAFLRLVTQTTGIALYTFTDGRRTNFFYQLPGQPLQELKYKKYFSEGRVTDIPEYKQQLNNLFSEKIQRQNLFRELEVLPYAEGRLEGFLQQLFPAEKRPRKQLNPATGWYVSAGIAINNLSVTEDESYDPITRKSETSYSPLVSLGYFFPLKRNVGRFFIFPQLKLFRYKNSNQLNNGDYILSTTYQTDLATVLELNAGVNLINHDNLRFFVAGGAGLMTQLNGKAVRQHYTVADRTPHGRPDSKKLASATSAINAAAGMVVNNKIQVTATYQVPALLANYRTFIPRLSGVQFSVGYKL